VGREANGHDASNQNKLWFVIQNSHIAPNIRHNSSSLIKNPSLEHETGHEYRRFVSTRSNSSTNVKIPK
jgi:hypothetical protein